MREKDKLAITEIEMTYYRLIIKNWTDYYLKAEIISKDKSKELASEYERLFDRHSLIVHHIDWVNISRERILDEVHEIIINQIEKYDSIFYTRNLLKDKFNIVDEEESDEFYMASDFQSECLRSIEKSIKDYLSSDNYKIYTPDPKDPSKCGSIQFGNAIHEWLKKNP